MDELVREGGDGRRGSIGPSRAATEGGTTETERQTFGWITLSLYRRALEGGSGD